MDLVEYAKLVESLRLIQKSYFRTKSAQTLQECKTLEKLVDSTTQGILHGKQKSLL